MPFLKTDLGPVNGGATAVMRKRHLSGEEIRRQTTMAAHPTSVPSSPRLLDRSRAYEPFEHADAGSVSWPRAVIRMMPGMARGEHVWAVKIWESAEVPARNRAGMLNAFTMHDRDEAIDEARERVEAMRWSNLARLRLEGRPQYEPPC
ncbi:hypothetical protein [Arthrobacter sp. MYb213]|uniref:hypothetical protein n=1 Tax=Arthrobacter sp. MYb213 TaxID=1848595 RepID=UPI000CFAFEF8|nr:hypothetical protein [Arthrobacter sp. MYb213]PRB69495.1 hypothetical protein CQ011_12090 [Arthrobacter sp. MYb213]